MVEAGDRFGRLTVIGKDFKNHASHWYYKTICDCGNEKTIAGYSLTRGCSKSCGCFRTERIKKATTTHGHTPIGNHSKTYVTWDSMKARCFNPKNHNYPRYGARGITVCERWLKFENFLEDMGERPEGKTIDRIDNEKGYEPGNCKWSTPKEQANNRRKRVI